jgi:hypothetical protein
MGAVVIQGRWIAAMAAAGTRGFTGLAEAAQRFEHLLFVPQALGIGGLLQLLPVAPHQVAQRQIVAGPQPGVLQLQQQGALLGSFIATPL